MSRRTISGIMLVLLLVGMFSFSRNLGAECTVSETSKVSTSMLAYENITTHEGDLIIDGTQTYVIENCTYLQNGNIVVEDWTALILSNSRLTINPFSSPDRYQSEVYIQVKDSAHLNIQNVTIESSCWAGIMMSDGAIANITMLTNLCGGAEISGDSVITVAKSTLSGVSMSDRVKVSISSSQIGFLRLFFDRYSSARIVDLKPGFYEYWRLHENETVSEIIHPHYDLVIENSKVNGWSLSVEHDATLAIMNSTLADLSLRIHDATLQLGELHIGYIADWSLGSVKLTNSVTLHWSLGISNSEVVVANSTIGFWIVGEANATIKDSKILDIEAANHVGSITFDGVNNEVGSIRVARSNTLISGHAKFVGTIDDFVSSDVTRNYNILAEDAGGNPVINVELALLDSNGTVVWNGVSETLGRTDFNLTFTDTNYTDTLKLGTFKEGFYNVTEYIKFLSDTPISINLTQKPLGDINEDHVVNILDIFVVANAFGATPNDANWNATADLNSDNVVNILDVFAVAWDFGKTV